MKSSHELMQWFVRFPSRSFLPSFSQPTLTKYLEPEGRQSHSRLLRCRAVAEAVQISGVLFRFPTVVYQLPHAELG